MSNRDTAVTGWDRVFLVHGYLLRGTGSNIYVQNLARALCRLGQSVTLFSQDPEPEKLDFVSEVVVYHDGDPQIRLSRATPYPAPCRAVRPDIGDLLPVYVWDRYPGFRVLEFSEVGDADLEAYIEGNRRALAAEMAYAPPAAIFSNHAVMQPAYVARGRRGRGRHVALLHGSALNFTVRGDHRMGRYAREGLEDADALAAPSVHAAADLARVLPELADRRVHSVPPGVDLERFLPGRASPDGNGLLPPAMLARLESAICARPGGRDEETRRALRRACGELDEPEALQSFLQRTAKTYDAWSPDPGGARRLAQLEAEDELILYFGKYLPTKGLRVLLAALPLILRHRPRARVVAVGFGEDREFLEAGAELLDAGRRDLFERFFLEADESGTLRGLIAYLADPTRAAAYYDAARGKLRERFITTGIMEQDDLGSLVGYADLTVAPSIFPEAFGLVGAEALAAGVLPILTAGSGFEEVARTYVDAFEDLLGGTDLSPLPVDGDLVIELADRSVALLEALDALSRGEREQLRCRARSLAEKSFSWERAARDLLGLAGIVPG